MTTPEGSSQKKPAKSEQSFFGKLFQWFRQKLQPCKPVVSTIPLQSLHRSVTNNDQLAQPQPEMVMGMQQRLFIECPTTHVAPPLLGEFAPQYVWPVLAPGVPVKWQSVIRQLPVQGEGVDIAKKKDDKQSEKPLEKSYKSPKPGLNERFQREH